MTTQHATPPVIRLATPDDYAAIEDIVVSIYISEGYTSPNYVDHLRTTASRAETTDLLVAVDQDSGKVLGSVSVMTAGGPYSQIARDGEAEMRLLAMDPAARGRGGGEALVRACLERARTAGMVRLVLSTQPTMTAAHRLYERTGFQRATERDWVLPHGVPMLVYTKDL